MQLCTRAQSVFKLSLRLDRDDVGDLDERVQLCTRAQSIFKLFVQLELQILNCSKFQQSWHNVVIQVSALPVA